MKTLLNLVAISTILLITSCTRQVNTPSNNNTGSNSTNGTTVTGNFAITQFTDSDPFEDKTAGFADYAFQFTEDGKIIATIGGTSTQGTYTEKPSHEGEGAKLTISFSSQPLNSLNKSWLIETITDTNINLKDDDASASEVLQFSSL
jgi:hypothetical protein